jgi:hypothetical protein
MSKYHKGVVTSLRLTPKDENNLLTANGFLANFLISNFYFLRRLYRIVKI